MSILEKILRPEPMARRVVEEKPWYRKPSSLGFYAFMAITTATITYELLRARHDPNSVFYRGNPIEQSELDRRPPQEVPWWEWSGVPDKSRTPRTNSEKDPPARIETEKNYRMNSEKDLRDLPPRVVPDNSNVDLPRIDHGEIDYKDYKTSQLMEPNRLPPDWEGPEIRKNPLPRDPVWRRDFQWRPGRYNPILS
jgi:hypothetical protein